MGDNLIGFVDGHILNEEAHRAFAFAHGGLGIMSRTGESVLGPPAISRALLRTYLVLIALVVLFFNSSCLFQLTQFGIPFRF